MPVNPYDDRKVSLRRPHRNGDLGIVRASYTRRKANVTEALGMLIPSMSVCPSIHSFVNINLSFNLKVA